MGRNGQRSGRKVKERRLRAAYRRQACLESFTTELDQSSSSLADARMSKFLLPPPECQLLSSPRRIVSPPYYHMVPPHLAPPNLAPPPALSSPALGFLALVSKDTHTIGTPAQTRTSHLTESTLIPCMPTSSASNIAASTHPNLSRLDVDFTLPWRLIPITEVPSTPAALLPSQSPFTWASLRRPVTDWPGIINRMQDAQFTYLEPDSSTLDNLESIDQISDPLAE